MAWLTSRVAKWPAPVASVYFGNRAARNRGVAVGGRLAARTAVAGRRAGRRRALGGPGARPRVRRLPRGRSRGRALGGQARQAQEPRLRAVHRRAGGGALGRRELGAAPLPLGGR